MVFFSTTCRPNLYFRVNSMKNALSRSLFSEGCWLFLNVLAETGLVEVLNITLALISNLDRYINAKQAFLDFEVNFKYRKHFKVFVALSVMAEALLSFLLLICVLV